MINTLQDIYSPTKNGKTPFVVGMIVLLIGVFATVVFSDVIVRRGVDDFQNQSNQQMSVIGSYVRHKDTSLSQLLRDAAAMIRMIPDISREQWDQYFTDNEVLQIHPELLLVGYAENVPIDMIDEYEARYGNTASVWPLTEPSYTTPITYMASLTPMEADVYGYSMSSDPLRRIAIERARDTGESAMTGPVRLVQDRGNPGLFGVLIYYPIYYGDSKPTTVEERRERLRGFSYVAMRPKDLVDSIDQTILDSARSNFKIIDTDARKEMYATSNKINQNDAKYIQSQEVEIGGRKWTIILESYQPSIQRWANPGVTFVLGIITSVVAGFVCTYLLGARLYRISQKHEDEIAQAKTDLLALASHQLRTPASGVKQYVGMLREGFAGKLKPDQMRLVEKAYEANERQLEIVNQLLYVAKADANQLRVHPVQIKPYRIIQDVLSSLESLALRKQVAVESQLDEGLAIEADPQYVYMIVDNLVTNSIKYSEDNGEVMVRLASEKDGVVIEVIDKGIGIGEEHFPYLFDKFHRIDSDLSQKEGGTGLGLFLTKKLTEAHGGQVEVESVAGEGTTFRVYLPSKFVATENPDDTNYRIKKRRKNNV